MLVLTPAILRLNIAYFAVAEGWLCSISDYLSCSHTRRNQYSLLSQLERKISIAVQLHIYTHRQKLSNSKLVLNVKKCFVPKYWKFNFYYLHFTSFE